MMAKTGKINLDLVKAILAELEADLVSAEKIRETGTDPQAYVIQLSRAIGLASGVSQEALMLIADMNKLVQMAAAATQSNDKSVLEDIKQALGKINGKGNLN